MPPVDGRLSVVELRDDPKKPCNQGRKSALLMRCSLGGAEGHSVSSAVIGPADTKRENPCDGKGFDAGSRGMSSDDKVPKVGLEPTCPCGHWILSQTSVFLEAFDVQRLARIVTRWSPRTD